MADGLRCPNCRTELELSRADSQFGVVGYIGAEVLFWLVLAIGLAVLGTFGGAGEVFAFIAAAALAIAAYCLIVRRLRGTSSTVFWCSKCRREFQRDQLNPLASD